MPTSNPSLVFSAISLLILLLLPGTRAPTQANRVEFEPITETMTSSEAWTVLRAGDIANRVKNSACFHDFMLNRALVETNGQTPKQVADALRRLSGRVSVGMYYRCLYGTPNCVSPTRAVAYRQPPDGTVYLNRAYYDVDALGFDIYELAGSLAHEALGHSLGGYDHSYDWTPIRDWSVPYSISGASKKNDDAFQHCSRNFLTGRPRE